jgi:hypothetical protein
MMFCARTMKSPSRCGLLLLAAALSGCDGSGDAVPLAEVTGKVHVAGKPIPADFQVLAVEETTGITGRGATDANGRFSIKPLNKRAGIPIGRYRFGITEKSTPDVQVNGPEYQTIMAKGGAADGKMQQPPPSVIPQKAQSPANSPLVFEIKEGSNDLDLDLSTVN